MTRIVSGLIFYIMYSFIYWAPVIILMTISKLLNLDIRNYLERLGFIKYIIGLLIVGYAMIIPAYRAKLASSAYGERDMKFWEAHSVSGAILKTHLSFLPIVGKFYEDKND